MYVLLFSVKRGGVHKYSALLSPVDTKRIVVMYIPFV